MTAIATAILTAILFQPEAPLRIKRDSHPLRIMPTKMTLKKLDMSYDRDERGALDLQVEFDETFVLIPFVSVFGVGTGISNRHRRCDTRQSCGRACQGYSSDIANGYSVECTDQTSGRARARCGKTPLTSFAKQ